MDHCSTVLASSGKRRLSDSRLASYLFKTKCKGSLHEAPSNRISKLVRPRDKLFAMNMCSHGPLHAYMYNVNNTVYLYTYYMYVSGLIPMEAMPAAWTTPIREPFQIGSCIFCAGRRELRAVWSFQFIEPVHACCPAGSGHL